MNVLLVEDEKLFAKSVQRRLQRSSHQAVIADTIEAAKAYLAEQIPDILLLDVRLPDGNGLELLSQIKAADNTTEIPVIMMTAYDALQDAVDAMKLGAADYLKKPVDLDELMLTLDKVAENQQLTQQLDYSKVRESHGTEKVNIVGHSHQIVDIKAQLERIAVLTSKSSHDTPTLLITGETGTGKDLLARYYHECGLWRSKPFVHIDCASLPESLIEAELFGYEKGAFTNANQAKAGLIEVAESGTLFLDEIGELPLELQAKLLNVLERRIVRRLGSVKEHPVQAHFVAATNRDLKQMVEQGRFRSDLYFRLNVLGVHLPALREREVDILPLAAHFVALIARRYGLATPEFTGAAVNSLQQYDWPGNIRELEHVLERAVILSHDGRIDSGQLMLDKLSAISDKPQADTDMFDNMTIEQVEKMMIERALQRASGNVSQAARKLGLTRMALRYRMEKYQL